MVSVGKVLLFPVTRPSSKAKIIFALSSPSSPPLFRQSYRGDYRPRARAECTSGRGAALLPRRSGSVVSPCSPPSPVGPRAALSAPHYLKLYPFNYESLIIYLVFKIIKGGIKVGALYLRGGGGRILFRLGRQAVLG